ncbi:MAG: hypothetical protein KBS91_01340 [Firmicutes bacterium]|nr:hypothetical protein [Candidatus Caballimonas caccae]
MYNRNNIPNYNHNMQSLQNMQQLIQQVNQWAKLSKSSNPNAIYQQLAQQNPQVAQQVEQMMKNGGSPKEMALNMLRQNGIDPTMFINMVNQYK